MVWTEDVNYYEEKKRKGVVPNFYFLLSIVHKGKYLWQYLITLEPSFLSRFGDELTAFFAYVNVLNIITCNN